MAKTTRNTTITTEYFEAVKTLPEVREIAVLNLDKIDDPEFVKQFKKAYNANRENQVSRYGRYKAKAAVTAEGYLKICRAIKAITEIKVGRSKIKLTIAFKYGGVNFSGDTKAIKDILKDGLGCRWNPKSAEWYNSFAVMPKIPAIPERVEPVKAKAPAKKAASVKAAAPKKLAGKDKDTAIAEFKAKAAAKKASIARKAKAVKAIAG